MKFVMPPVRLLPMTIATLAAMLALKSVQLVRASTGPGAHDAVASLASATDAMVPAAQASPPPTPPASAASTTVPPTNASPNTAAPSTAASTSAPSTSAPSTSAPSTGAPSTTAAPVATQVSSSSAHPAAQAGADPIQAPRAPEIAEGERAVLLDLRHRRDELDAREQKLAAHESLLSAAEARLSARVAELQSLQSKLESLEASRREREEANWRGLVKVYETMKPRDAATIMNDMDNDVLLQVLDRMKESKTAPLLAAMDPTRARAATAQLAELRTRSNTIPVAR